MKVRINTESNFETSQDKRCIIREGKYKLFLPIMYSKVISISVAVACWYSSSSINAIATQRLFQGLLGSSLLQHELDNLNATINAEAVQQHVVILMSVLLTLSQLIMGGIMGLALLYILGGQPAVISPSQQMTGTSTPRNHHVLEFHQQIQRQDMLIGLFHCIGCICTSMGFGYGSASLVQIIKLLEPIETLFLSALVRKSFEVLSFRKLSSMVIISAGTYMLLANTSIEAKPRSIIFAIASGFCIASRNVLSKEREKGLGVAQSVSPEGSSEANFKEVLRKGIKKFAYITITAAVFAFILALVMMFRSLQLLKLMIPPLMKISPRILTETIIFHCLYNMASITVLSLTSAPSHSLLNVGKRIVNVIIASMAFNVAISSSGKAGLVVAFIGACVYNEKIASIMKETKYSRKKRFTVCTVVAIACLTSMQFDYFDDIKGDDILSRETQFLFQKTEVIDDRSSSRKNKVILLGPHDRYNFGDLIFSKVVAKLLTSRAGYSQDEIVYGGLVSVNMSAYGGPSSVLSMKQIQNLSRSDDIHGPYDIIFTGGEVMGCNHACGLSMMQTQELRAQAQREKVYECAYVFPKHLLLPEHLNFNKSLNYAVGNSLGGAARGKQKACWEGIDTADHAVFRDGNPLYPDSAVMTKELFADQINEAANEVLQDLFPTRTGNVRKFVAVQHNGWPDGKLAAKKGLQKKLASGLDEVSRGLNVTIIFFAAGTAPHHDSFADYQGVASFMEEEAIVYKAENMWKVVGLISRAEAVLSTSLHVRIMAFIHLKPRVTWCGEGKKHSDFISVWDTNTSTPCVSDETMTWNLLRQHYYTDPEMSRASTAIKYEETVQMYLESFSDYSALLRPPVQ
jgi:drug/metabolite transporter (DMT)-like permease